jgi:replicative DNA helicase
MATVDRVLEKGLPGNLDAERSVLGAVLLDNAAYTYAAELLLADDFSNDAHRRIFARMVALAETARPIDPVTLTEELLRTGELEAIGGVAYLSVLTESLPRSVNAAHYARIVKDKAVLRRLAHTSNGILREALEGSDDTGAILDRAESAIMAVGEDRGREGLMPLGEVFRRTYRSMDDLLERGKRITGLVTRFTHFDDLTCGLQPSDLIIIAGRPSMGKTAWALSVAANVAIRSAPMPHRGQPVAIFSLEMSKEALLTRLLCAEAGVDSHKFRSGFLNKEDNIKLAQAMGRLAQAPIYIDDTPGLRLQEMHAKARRLKKDHGLALVLLDYLQLMTAPKAENRNQEISALSRGLKALAKELEVPVMTLSQLSRAPEHRGGADGGHRPQLADLRDSGSIEQDADVVGFLYREEYYMRMMGREVPDEVAGRAEMIIAKQRNGPTGKVHMAFLDRFARFENLAESVSPF